MRGKRVVGAGALTLALAAAACAPAQASADTSTPQAKTFAAAAATQYCPDGQKLDWASSPHGSWGEYEASWSNDFDQITCSDPRTVTPVDDNTVQVRELFYPKSLDDVGMACCPTGYKATSATADFWPTYRGDSPSSSSPVPRRTEAATPRSSWADASPSRCTATRPPDLALAAPRTPPAPARPRPKRSAQREDTPMRGRRLAGASALVLAGSLAGTFLGSTAQAQDSGGTRAAQACTPSSKYSECLAFTATGSWQSFTFPAGVDHVRVHMWAGGGAGTAEGDGGGSGYTSAVITGSPGQELQLAVGEGGQSGGPGGWGAGSGGAATGTGAAGGGASAVKIGDMRVLVAGGGGGAGASNNGGAGGGVNGLDGDGGTFHCGAHFGGGAHGDQGGAAGCSNQGPGAAGDAAAVGGTGGTGGSGNFGGGAGGGGYAGGGGGSAGWTDQDDSGGGGGSGYVAAADNVKAATTSAGSGSQAAGQDDPLRPTAVGNGATDCGPGQSGAIVLEWGR
jgi:hypothetical protein